MQFSDVRATTIELTRFASVTNSPGETAFAPFLAGKIAGLPWFASHPDDLVLEVTANDPVERSVVYAFVRGAGDGCVVLTGHYDVVSAECYGDLADLAFDPAPITAALVDRLGAADGGERSALVLDDLGSGAFLAGRGILDMKSGLAAGLAVLERFAMLEERPGSLLLLAVPDEEDSSHGMLHAATRLGPFLASRGCRAAAIVNLDSAVDGGDGSSGRAVFLGSVGKLLPFALFVGRPTHAGAPFDGVNPALMAAEFVRLVESDPAAFGDAEGPGDEAGERPSPPTFLYLGEDRASYDVTTPATVFCAFNLLTHRADPRTVLDRVGILAGEAMRRALALLEERAARYAGRPGSVAAAGLAADIEAVPVPAPRVIDYASLLPAAGESEPGADTASGRPEDDRAGPGRIDPVRESGRRAVRAAERAGVEGPAAIVGFAPPYYPRCELVPGRDDAFRELLGSVADGLSEETGESIVLRPYFPGISDLSHVAPADDPGQAAFVAARSPFPGSISVREGLGCPGINIGPWGRDYHQKTERVNVRYTFGVLPELLWRTTLAVLGAAGSRDAEDPGAAGKTGKAAGESS